LLIAAQIIPRRLLRHPHCLRTRRIFGTHCGRRKFCRFCRVCTLAQGNLLPALGGTLTALGRI
jgi:hypothetical protein